MADPITNNHETPKTQGQGQTRVDKTIKEMKKQGEQTSGNLNKIVSNPEKTKKFNIDGHTLTFARYDNTGAYKIFFDGTDIGDTYDPYGLDREPFSAGLYIYVPVCDYKGNPEYEEINTETNEKTRREDIASDPIDINGKPLILKKGTRTENNGCLVRVEYDGEDLGSEYQRITDIDGHHVSRGTEGLSLTIDNDGHIGYKGKRPDRKYEIVYRSESGYTTKGPYDILDVKNKAQEQETSNRLEIIKDLQPAFNGIDFSKYESITNVEGEAHDELRRFRNQFKDNGAICFVGKIKDGGYEFVYQNKSDPEKKGYTIIGPYDKLDIDHSGNFPTMRCFKKKEDFTIGDDKTVIGYEKVDYKMAEELNRYSS